MTFIKNEIKKQEEKKLAEVAEKEYDKEFNSIAECLEYLANEGNLCAGDSIEFFNINPWENEEIKEVRTFGMFHNISSKYKINNK